MNAVVDIVFPTGSRDSAAFTEVARTSAVSRTGLTPTAESDAGRPVAADDVTAEVLSACEADVTECWVASTMAKSQCEQRMICTVAFLHCGYDAMNDETVVFDKIMLRSMYNFINAGEAAEKSCMASPAACF